MSRKRKPPLQASQLQGFKYFSLLCPLLERLHADGCGRDKAGNRLLFYDQYASLLLLYFFSPVVTSLRGLQQATELDKVQKLLGVRRTSLGSLSEASRVFDPALLAGLAQELVARVGAAALPKDREALRGLTAVDGSLLPALPRMAWALWQDDRHRAAKLHLHFEVARGVSVDAAVTPANDSEIQALRDRLVPGRLYVLDRGYAAYKLLGDILRAHASFIVRLQENAAYTVKEVRPLSPRAKAAGVLSDVVISRLGTDHHKDEVGRPLRVVRVATGKVNPDGSPQVLLLCTDRLDLDADLVALGYKFRWSVELFFRWLKQILGLRHLLGGSLEGVTLQVYAALIACLLITLWAGKKANKRTFEMFCFYFTGWASEEELLRHIQGLQETEEDSS